MCRSRDFAIYGIAFSAGYSLVAPVTKKIVNRLVPSAAQTRI